MVARSSSRKKELTPEEKHQLFLERRGVKWESTMPVHVKAETSSFVEEAFEADYVSLHDLYDELLKGKSGLSFEEVESSYSTPVFQKLTGMTITPRSLEDAFKSVSQRIHEIDVERRELVEDREKLTLAILDRGGRIDGVLRALGGSTKIKSLISLLERSVPRVTDMPWLRQYLFDVQLQIENDWSGMRYDNETFEEMKERRKEAGLSEIPHFVPRGKK